MIDFFIKRPIFAGVISILMVLIGILSLLTLPIAQFPEIIPPQIQVTTQYLGAYSQVVSDTVTTPLEKAINGINGVSFINSSSSNLGYSLINVNFSHGTNLNAASSDVFANVSNTLAKLPAFVNQVGITVKKVSKNMVLVVNLIDKYHNYDSKFLGNYGEINIVPVLKRIYGVGDVQNYGLLQYAIRIWLDPQKMATLNMVPEDVMTAIKDQNQQAALGIFAQPPTRARIQMQLQLITEPQLKDPEKYEEIVVKVLNDGKIVRIKDIGKVEIGAQSYDSATQYDNNPTAAIGIYQYPTGNAVDIAKKVRQEMQKLKKYFPPGVDFEIAYDTTLFVKEAIKEVSKTLFEAMLLVFLVVFIFLQNFRTTLIPCIAIPVSLIGTFTFFKLFNFSINTLSLLGLVLAIGLVVDDAIVVVENVERKLEEGIEDIKEATRLATEEVKSPIIATTLILLAVFVPVAFIPGISGLLYHQFALAIAFSVLLSGINSLTLSPALCGVLLKHKKNVNTLGFLAFFEKYFSKFTYLYQQFLENIFQYKYQVLTAFCGLFVLMIFSVMHIPKSFLPDEDQGYLILVYQKKNGYNIYGLENINQKLIPIINKTPGIKHNVSIMGLNVIDQIIQPNDGVMFLVLDSWKHRQKEGLTAAKIAKKLQDSIATIPDLNALVMPPPSIPGLSTVGGFQFVIEDRSFSGLDKLNQVVQNFLKEGKKVPEIAYMMTNLSIDTPAIYLDLNRQKAKALKLSIAQVYQTLQTYFGSYYVNNFTQFGQIFRVMVQADSKYRLNQEQLSQIYVKNVTEDMIPLSSIVTLKYKTTAYNVPHYNLYTSAFISGAAAKGISSGQVIKAIEALGQKTLPKGMVIEWTGVTDAQIRAGNIAAYIFALCLIFVFLFLAALYESWSMPFMILLVVPLAILGAVLGLMIRNMPLDVYGQIGLILLIGLAAKNAILIVEFAKQQQLKGKDMLEAVKIAALLRLRPILMTSFAFIFGVIPLVFAEGAGAFSRQSLGTTVMFGMLLATFLTLVVIPIFYVLIESWLKPICKIDESNV